MKPIYLLISSLLILTASCKDSILNETPPNLITTETLYTDYSGFDAGVNGLYALIRLTDEGLDGGSSLTSDLFKLGTDNLVSNHQVSPYNSVTTRWGVNNNSTNSFYSGTFSWLYRIVNSANTIIEQAENIEVDWQASGKSNIENKNYILANAKATRAWAYRHLSYLWGDVPLNLNSTKGSNIVTNWKRTPKGDVQKLIVEDLKFALQHIPIEPLAGRISKGAVGHFLAETYFNLHRLDSAAFYAEQVVQNSSYKLVNARYGVKKGQPGVPFMDMFIDGNTNRSEGNTEALWVFQFERQTVGGGNNSFVKRHHISRYNSIKVNGINPLKFSVERGGRGLGRNSLTKFAIDLYEPQDHRGSEYAIRKFFILRNAVQNAPAEADLLPTGYQYGDTLHLDWKTDISETNNALVNWPYSRKVEYTDSENIAGDLDYKDQIYLRLADTYLLYAEILFAQSKAKEAADMINIVRRRAGASEISSSQVNIDFILDERSRELVLEEDRRYTLLRHQKWIERTRKYNKNGGQYITERDTLFPIPQIVIDANLTEKMKQNEGY
ncbi:RagB/SusD family nutrient uptake outer membrane protein [Sphingobacterium sp. SYP-B4668]|uniref:RagB/SusD family nutrient uptake outer membrane protein n=1 Tax=Sphingobacterium sp. SYP-B4668 TaxID=2996035 RepID=UPI0022DD11F6|nr:RagB/SusD family nutrient uptake outer membrane protein [Sphingobacterium sp. SYP-B4668]